MKFMKKDQKGFSLVELMVVVAIIGILAALAVPRFQTFQAKARQSEAKSNLSHIFTLETMYNGDNDAYVAFTFACGTANAIGFNLTDCTKVRYGYVVTANATTFTGTAADGGKVFPGCGTTDTWTIDQDKKLQNSVNALAACM